MSGSHSASTSAQSARRLTSLLAHVAAPPCMHTNVAMSDASCKLNMRMFMLMHMHSNAEQIV